VQQKLNPVFHLRPILELATIYPRETMLKAFALVREYNTFSCHFIRGLIEKEAPQEAAPEPRANSLWAVPAITVRAKLISLSKASGGEVMTEIERLREQLKRLSLNASSSISAAIGSSSFSANSRTIVLSIFWSSANEKSILPSSNPLL
jgi:hypothetical protein